MSKLTFLIFVILISFSLSAQRYLTPVFNNVTATNNIKFGSAVNYKGVNEDLFLNFYEPTNDTEDKRPLIIYVHGGGFIDTTQSKDLIHIVAYCDSMSSRGYATASINYRLDSSISNRAVINAMHDAKAAIRFFKANASLYKLDTSLFFIGGESAGAITSLTSSYINNPNEVNYPPTSPISSDLSVEGNSGSPGFSSNTKATMCLCGGTKTVFNEPLFDTLAIENSNDNPIIVVHGTDDQLIPTVYSIQIALRANSIEVPYLFHPMYEATHCPWFFPLQNSWEYLDTLINYTAPFLYACVNSNSTTIDEDNNDLFSVYPNPSSGIFNVRLADSKTISAVIEVRNLVGELVYSSNEKAVKNEFYINLENLSSSVYLLSILVEEQRFNKYIVKE